jgi:Uma2 family endonuclease
MVAKAKIRVTFAEYAAMPETNQIVELIDGEIVRETIINLSPHAHQETLSKVKSYLVNELKIGLLYNAQSGFHFHDGNSFEPDLFWISPKNEGCYLEEDGRYWHGAPDLVIEILSPTTASNDRGTKFDTYEKNGVREYWMVDPDAKFTEVHRHDGSRFERQGVFKPDQPFVSAVLGGAPIDSQNWYAE